MGTQATSVKRRGRQPKAAASDAPEPVESTGDSTQATCAKPRGRQPKVAASDAPEPTESMGDSTQATSAKPRRGRTPKAAASAEDADQNSNEGLEAGTRPLRRLRSKLSETAGCQQTIEEVACGLCTYLNAPESSHCEMCENPLGDQKAGVARIADVA